MSRLQAAGDIPGTLRLNSHANVMIGALVFPLLAFAFVFTEEMVTIIYTASYVDAVPVMRVYIVGFAALAFDLTGIMLLLRQGAFMMRVGLVVLLLSVILSWFSSHACGLVGGAERHSIAVMNRLAERGHECHAVYIRNKDIQLKRIRLRDGGAVRCLNATRYFDGRALADFADHIFRIRPSAIVAANPYALMYSSLALSLSRLRVPLIVTYHSTRLLGVKEQLQMMIYRLFFWMTDCSVFVCERQRRYWRRRGV